MISRYRPALTRTTEAETDMEQAETFITVDGAIAAARPGRPTRGAVGQAKAKEPEGATRSLLIPWHHQQYVAASALCSPERALASKH